MKTFFAVLLLLLASATAFAQQSVPTQPPAAPAIAPAVPPACQIAGKPEQFDPFWQCLCSGPDPASPNRYDMCSNVVNMRANMPYYGGGYRGGYYPPVSSYGYGYSGYYGYINPLLFSPEPCRDFPANRSCVMGKIKFNTSELLGNLKALVRKLGLSVADPIIAYAAPIDDENKLLAPLDEKGPVTKHNNFFNNPVRLRAGRWLLAFRLGDRYFTTTYAVESEYLNHSDNQIVHVTLERIQEDPSIGTIIQQNRTVTYADWVRGRD